MKINKLYIGLFVLFMVLILITYINISRYTEGMIILPNKSNITPEDYKIYKDNMESKNQTPIDYGGLVTLKYQKEDLVNFMKVGNWSLSWTPEGTKALISTIKKSPTPPNTTPLTDEEITKQIDNMKSNINETLLIGMFGPNFALSPLTTGQFNAKCDVKSDPKNPYNIISTDLVDLSGNKLDYNTLPSLISGFKFLKEPCNPCIGLTYYNNTCPIYLPNKQYTEDNIPDTLQYFWGLGDYAPSISSTSFSSISSNIPSTSSLPSSSIFSNFNTTASTPASTETTEKSPSIVNKFSSLF